MTSNRRVLLAKSDPASYKILASLSTSAEESALAAGIDPLLVELIKIRTSQINGCAYCLRLHVGDAVKKGETTERLAVLSAWRETSYFSDVEQAALALTEAIANVSDGQVPDEVYDPARAQLGDDKVSAVAWLALVMNAFNRLAITSRTRTAPA